MISQKEKILNEIKGYYIKSSDYNGLPLSYLKNYDYDLLCELIDEEKITVLTENEVLNPHIKGFDIDVPKETMKKYVEESSYWVVLYPTRKALKSTRKIEGKPYTDILRKGEAQFKIVYFDIEILEKYFDDPRFSIFDSGYRGSICPKDEFATDYEIEDEYIKDYGMAYTRTGKFDRAVGVFVRDLANLSAKAQQLWKGHEKRNQNNYIVCGGFVKNLICGEWVEEIWTFEAAVRIMSLISDQCSAIGMPSIFRETYNPDNLECPEDYRLIFSPTKKNYEAFIVVLEKMFVGNISIDAFLYDGPFVKSVERKNEDGSPKGSLQLFEEWLTKNIKFKNGTAKDVLAPLRTLRKDRQVPAHEIKPNEYDLAYYKKQQDTINSVLKSMINIMFLLSDNPLARGVEIPEWVMDETKIVNY